MERRTLLFALLITSTAHADKVKVVQEEDRTVVRRRSAVDFSATEVEGAITRPDGAYVLHRNSAEFQSLIRLRDNFAPELTGSANDL